jgi:hypothetical protein
MSTYTPKLGDRVRVINRGRQFSGYRVMAAKLKLPRFKYEKTINNGWEGEVIGWEADGQPGRIIVGVDNGYQSIMINKEGLELVQPASIAKVSDKKLGKWAVVH